MFDVTPFYGIWGSLVDFKHSCKYWVAALQAEWSYLYAVLRIRIRMDPYDFVLLDPHPESTFQMRIPDEDANPD